MKASMRSMLVAALVVCPLIALTVGQASAATLKESGGSAFLAVYGNPGANGATGPVGGGLARNFGFAENLLFQACSACTIAVGEDVSLTIGGTANEVQDTEVGASLTSNKTGEGNPLSAAIQFIDFQDGTLAGYTDTYDRPSIMLVCSTKSEKGKCKTDPSFNTPAGSVKIEDVSIALGAPEKITVLQGTVWGKWENGEAKKAPCIKLELPPEGAASDQTLIQTEATGGIGAVGDKITALKGKVCLVSANNSFYKISGTVSSEPAIEIANE